MKVGKICIREVATISPEESVAEAARLMMEREIGSLIVIDDLRRPLGIVTDRDVMVRSVKEGQNAKRTRVEKIMSAPAAWVRETSGLNKAVDEMARLRVRRLPLVDEGDRLVGVLALDAVLLRHLEEDTPLRRALRATM